MDNKAVKQQETEKMKATVQKRQESKTKQQQPVKAKESSKTKVQVATKQPKTKQTSDQVTTEAAAAKRAPSDEKLTKVAPANYEHIYTNAKTGRNQDSPAGGITKKDMALKQIPSTCSLMVPSGVIPSTAKETTAAAAPQPKQDVDVAVDQVPSDLPTFTFSPDDYPDIYKAACQDKDGKKK